MVVGNVVHRTTINGRDTSAAFNKFKLEKNIGQAIRSAKLTFTRKLNTILDSINENDRVVITRGINNPSKVSFEGRIDSVTRQGAKIMLSCRDEIVTLLRKNVTYSYDGVLFPDKEAKGSDIMYDLVTRHGGLACNVTDTGPVTMRRFIVRGESVFSALNRICAVYDYMFYWNPEKRAVDVVPKGGVVASIPLKVGGTNPNVTGSPKWTTSASGDVINQIIIKGAVQESDLEQSFNGTGQSEQRFTLANTPISVKVYEGTTLKKLGVPDSTSEAYDYYVNKTTKQIICTARWTPASGTNNVKIEYTGAVPIPISLRHSASIAKYGESRTKEFVWDDVQSVAEARTRGQALLDKIALPYVDFKGKCTKFISYEPGQQVRIIDEVTNVERTLVINKIEQEYPYEGDMIYAGDKEWKLAEWQQHIEERIQAIEEKDQNDIDNLVTLEDIENVVGMHPRFAKGSLQVGSNTTEQFIVWHKDTYVEDFRDSLFHGSSSGATWNTTDKQIQFTTGTGIVSSKSVFRGGNHVARIRFTAKGQALNNLAFKVRSSTSTTFEDLPATSDGSSKIYEVRHVMNVASELLFYSVSVKAGASLIPGTSHYGIIDEIRIERL